MWFLYPRLVFVASRSTYQSIILVYPPSHLPSVLRPGPARRVDPGPGRPGSVAGPGPSKKQAGNWPGQTRSTRRVDPGTGRPGQTRLRPGYIFFIYPHARNDVVLAFTIKKPKRQQQRDESIAIYRAPNCRSEKKT